MPIPNRPTVLFRILGASSGRPNLKAYFLAVSREKPPQLSSMENSLSFIVNLIHNPSYIAELIRFAPSIELSNKSTMASSMDISRVIISIKNFFVGFPSITLVFIILLFFMIILDLVHLCR